MGNEKYLEKINKRTSKSVMLIYKQYLEKINKSTQINQ